MATYQVSILGDRFSYEVDAESREAARSEAMDEFMEEVQSQTEVSQKFSVYEVIQQATQCRINVRATSSTQAEEAVRQYTQDCIDELRDNAPPGHARSFLADLHVGAKCKGEVDSDHYELTEDGRWEEGSL